MQEITGAFRYEQDSKRYHRFQIETEAGVVGIIYVPKDIEKIPERITLKRVDA